MLHLLAEELARLPIANEELERLRSGLLDALSLVPSGVEPAAEEALADGLPLESQIIAEHLQRNGLGRLAEGARAKTKEFFRNTPQGTEDWVQQWHRIAGYLAKLASDLEELRRAEQAFVEDMTDENLQWFRTISDRIHRELVESAAG